MNRKIFILAGLILLNPPNLYAQPADGDKQERLNEERAADREARDILSKGKKASAYIKGTKPDSKVYGEAEFIEEKGGVSIFVEVYNVSPPGKHGVHVHEYGSCGEGGNAAGGHFNPHGVKHGFFPADGAEKSHPGDMGNVLITPNGEGILSVFLRGASLSDGEYNIDGKAIILHEREDDFGQPTGNAGGRIGCGIIELEKF